MLDGLRKKWFSGIGVSGAVCWGVMCGVLLGEMRAYEMSIPWFFIPMVILGYILILVLDDLLQVKP